MIKKFILKAIVAPFTVEVMQKVGEAVGDRLGYLINPPDDCTHPHIAEGDIEGELARVCMKCGARLEIPTEE